MQLTPGARVGAYEVVAAIGAGGMGEVYRARDTRLDRTVALKEVPSAVTSANRARSPWAIAAGVGAALGLASSGI